MFFNNCGIYGRADIESSSIDNGVSRVREDVYRGSIFRNGVGDKKLTD